ncbi:MAG: metalloregulator ArsR/SmtB family transcription factor [Lachnospiraceae bacterium]|nr:metalloregulator ArsR/SmtB family transcription factor [Lachnospiraceae bacterium]
MEEDYIRYAKILKVLADSKRLKIVAMLADKELCACDILEEFKITQPTLSHDMKLLCDIGIVNARKEGKWSYYSANREMLLSFNADIGKILTGQSR